LCACDVLHGGVVAFASGDGHGLVGELLLADFDFDVGFPAVALEVRRTGFDDVLWLGVDALHLGYVVYCLLALSVAHIDGNIISYVTIKNRYMCI